MAVTLKRLEPRPVDQFRISLPMFIWNNSVRNIVNNERARDDVWRDTIDADLVKGAINTSPTPDARK
jgi:hypothetical protein